LSQRRRSKIKQRSQLSFSLSLSFEHHDDCIGSRRSERVG
jgi:hypothetical protein